MKNKPVKIQSKTSTPLQSWPWYKVWIKTIFSPKAATGKAIISEGNVTFKQAVVWVILSFVVIQLFTSILAFIKTPTAITLNGTLLVLLNCVGGGLLSLIAEITLTGCIHLVAKLFRGKGNWHNFFIIWAAFNVPFWILFDLFVFFYKFYPIQDFLIIGPIVSFYWLFVVGPVAIKSNYNFRWLSAFLIYFIILIVYLFCFAFLYVTFFR